MISFGAHKKFIPERETFRCSAVIDCSFYPDSFLLTYFMLLVSFYTPWKHLQYFWQCFYDVFLQCFWNVVIILCFIFWRSVCLFNVSFHILKICMFVQCFLSYLQSSDCRHNVMNIPNCIIKSMKKLYLITKFSPVFIGICDCSWSTLLLWLTHWLPASNKASLRTKTQC